MFIEFLWMLVFVFLFDNFCIVFLFVVVLLFFSGGGLGFIIVLILWFWYIILNLELLFFLLEVLFKFFLLWVVGWLKDSFFGVFGKFLLFVKLGWDWFFWLDFLVEWFFLLGFCLLFRLRCLIFVSLLLDESLDVVGE